jgi:cell division protein FtsL
MNETYGLPTTQVTEGEHMKYINLIMIAVALTMLGPNLAASADNAEIQKEIQSLKERIGELEEKLEKQESLAKRQAA